MPKKKQPLDISKYNADAFWDDLDTIWNTAQRLGQTSTMLNIALLRARFTGLYSPLDELQKAKISRGDDGIIDVRILDYKDVTTEEDKDKEPAKPEARGEPCPQA